MINTLKTATGGYLKRQTKAVLIIAVAGYLNFSSTPPPPTPTPSLNGGGAGGESRRSHKTNKDYENAIKERSANIERDNNEILNIIEIFMRCQ